MTESPHEAESATARLWIVVRVIIPAVLAIAILWLSLTPSPPKISGLLGWDKLLHALAYGLLTVMLSQLLLLVSKRYIMIGCIAAVMSVFYGGTLEVVQASLDAGRTAEWTDLFADAIGAIVGCVIFCQGYVLYMKLKSGDDTAHG